MLTGALSFSNYFIFIFFYSLQSVSSAEVRDRGHGEKAREGHHAGDRRRRERRGHDSDGSRRRGDQRQRGHAGHQLFRLLDSTGGTQIQAQGPGADVLGQGRRGQRDDSTDVNDTSIPARF